MFARWAKKSFFSGLLVAILVELITFVVHHALNGLIAV